MRKQVIGLAPVLVLMIALVGCQERRETAEAPPPPPGVAAERAGERTGTAVERAGERVAGEAREAARTIGEAAENAALAAKVKNALIITKGLETGRLDVDATGEGVVTLEGSVPSAEQKARAERVAKNVEGVTNVVNELKVAP